MGMVPKRLLAESSWSLLQHGLSYPLHDPLKPWGISSPLSPIIPSVKELPTRGKVSAGLGAGGWAAQRGLFTPQWRLLIFRLAACISTAQNVQSDDFLGLGIKTNK